jgi:uncharacterized membrane protein YgaE (UPF0421/DUF939 family)
MIIQIGVIIFILYAATIGFHGYAMYEILRIVVMIQALIYAFLFYEDNKPVSAIFAGIAVLFNPLMKIRFSRGEWEVLDLGVAIIFAGTLAWLYWASNKNKKIQEAQVKEQEENHKRFEEIMAYKQKIRDITAEKQKLEESYWHLMRKNEKLEEELKYKDEDIEDLKEHYREREEDRSDEINLFVEYHYKKIMAISEERLKEKALQGFEKNKYHVAILYSIIDEDIFGRRDDWGVHAYYSYAAAVEIYHMGETISDFRDNEKFLKESLHYIYFHTMKYLRDERLRKYREYLAN